VANQPFLINQDGGCDLERLSIIDDYVRLENSNAALATVRWIPAIIPFNPAPSCELFTQNYPNFNVSSPSLWALVRSPVIAGFNLWQQGVGSSLTITSAYRTPGYNEFRGYARGSRHVFGDAIDVANPSNQYSDWLLRYEKAQAAGANWLEDRHSVYRCHCNSTECDCVHADWRNTGGSYVQ
jgi:hypothetical protein